MDTFTRAMLRVHGLPPTLTAFITSMAVLFQSAMTSARASVLAGAQGRRPLGDQLHAACAISDVRRRARNSLPAWPFDVNRQARKSVVAAVGGAAGPEERHPCPLPANILVARHAIIAPCLDFCTFPANKLRHVT